VGTLRALGDLKARLEKAKPGDAFFAHLLLPHYPYVVAGDCSALQFKEWKRRFGYWPPEALRHAYAGQLQCATSQVDELLQAFDRSPAGSNSLVFVHGDHGSRLTSVDPSEEYRGQFGREDVIAAYSTLFAVRAPAVRAGYYTEPYPIHTLLRDFSSSTPARAPSLTPPKVHEVWLDDEDWKPSSKIRLPASWLN
jgi:hypothetical protein